MPRRRAAIGLMAFCLSIALAGPGVAAEPVRLLMPVVYGTHLPGLGEPASRLTKLVKQVSGGALVLDLLESLHHERAALVLYRQLLGAVDGTSVFLEEFARGQISAEEQHQMELAKMLRDFAPSSELD